MKGNMDIALSSRVRLARNIEDIPFPNRMTAEQVENLITRVNEAVNADRSYMLLRMGDLPERERRLLVERHMVSPDLAAGDRGAALINKDETVSIMICEEDHLRIQCIETGLHLKEADEICSSIDKAIGEKLPYAFHARLGFLTACPTNVGTGMRASVMVHLPALSMLGQCEGLLTTVGKLGYAVRGIYGEGSGAPGHIYQISNQMTLGVLEEDVLSNLSATLAHVIEREKSLRGPLFKNNRVEVEDRIYRSLGALRYARSLQTGEGMEHLSNLKLGASLGLVDEGAQEVCNTLMTDIQGAAVEQRAGHALDERQRAEARADYMRTKIKKIKEVRQTGKTEE